MNISIEVPSVKIKGPPSTDCDVVVLGAELVAGERNFASKELATYICRHKAERVSNIRS
jgi:hypothetical protein